MSTCERTLRATVPPTVPMGPWDLGGMIPSVPQGLVMLLMMGPLERGEDEGT